MYTSKIYQNCTKIINKNSQILESNAKKYKKKGKCTIRLR